MPARSSARFQVLRSLLLFTPFLAVTAGVLAFLLRDIATDGASGGRIVGTVLVGFVTLLLAYQVVQSLRDVFSGLVETAGIVERRWSHNDLFLFRNSYIFVDRNVFRLDPAQFIDVELGDTVRVVHTPHTTMVESLEVTQRAGAGGRNG
jgi:hypothetical protein